MSAAGAPIAVAAQCGSTTARDCIEHIQVLTADPAMTAFSEATPGVGDDVGHLHEERPRRCVAQISGT